MLSSLGFVSGNHHKWFRKYYYQVIMLHSLKPNSDLHKPHMKAHLKSILLKSTGSLIKHRCLSLSWVCSKPEKNSSNPDQEQLLRRGGQAGKWNFHLLQGASPLLTLSESICKSVFPSACIRQTLGRIQGGFRVLCQFYVATTMQSFLL